MKYTVQSFKTTSSEILHHCKNNPKCKTIIISTTAKKAIDYQNKLDLWLDKNDDIKGDSVLVIGRLETELKFALTTEFTNTSFDEVNNPYSQNHLSPGFLIGTPGCIGAGLDSSDVQLVHRIGLPNSIVHFIQEMGRCGRANNDNERDDTFSLIFTLSDYVYLCERLYVIDSEESNLNELQNNEDGLEDNSFMSKTEERHLAISRLNTLLMMIVCNYGCWHVHLELMSSNPFNAQYYNMIDKCGGSCPYYNGSQNDYIKKINRHELCTFLTTTMMNNTSEFYTPTSLAKKLLDYPSVGKKIYGRQFATKCEKASDASITILQLLCCNIIHVSIEELKVHIAYCMLSLSGNEPNYMINEHWKYIDHY